MQSILKSGFNMRGYIYLIDYSLMPDRLFKYLLSYYNHKIKVE